MAGIKFVIILMVNRLKTEEWKLLTDLIKNRDENKCRRCGTGGKLSIHHLIPYKKVRTDNPKNLITVCDKCHYHLERAYLKYGETSYIRKFLQENKFL